jgi:hypothetical protein
MGISRWGFGNQPNDGKMKHLNFLLDKISTTFATLYAYTAAMLMLTDLLVCTADSPVFITSF